VTFAAESLIVAAHPDDEALWFSSLLGEAKGIVITYLEERSFKDFDARDLKSPRTRVMTNYPLPATWLEVLGSGCFKKALWDGRLGPFGCRISPKYPRYQEDYRRAYVEVVAGLSEAVAKYNPKRIVTHSPWGEYGHEDHVQVHKAVLEVAKAADLEVWFPLYCSKWTASLVAPHINGPNTENLLSFPCDHEMAHSLRELYVESGCWTWMLDYEWFPSESFARALPAADASTVGGAAVNYIRLPAYF